MVRTRFVQLLTDIRLKLNEVDIFSEFSKYFSVDDYQDILHFLTYKESSKYSNDKVMQLWEEIIDIKNKQYTNSLLGVFNKYCNISEFSSREDQLKKL